MKKSRNSPKFLVLGSTGFFLGTLCLTTPAKALPSANTTANFSGNVPGSCSTQTPFLPNPKPYSRTGTGPSGGRKVLSANVSALFNCNTDTVNVSANVTTLASPQFTNATNLDLKSNSSSIGSDHTVSIAVIGGPTLTSGATVNTTGVIPLDDTVSETDTNGNVNINLVSTFTSNLANGGEELAAGNYNAQILITVAAP